ncbi:MAG: ORF6N domain-containing protein [Betaproteobacteria bacterium]|nr:ORF6N domain-containing protein [Betaproteobacteria bacterium]
MVLEPTVPIEGIENHILLIRGHKVLLDADLAALYGVEARALNEAVKRNAQRFPPDFMFQLSARELENWRSQFVMSNPGAKMGLRRAPFAFTEHGALMAATVLNSPRAVETSLYVVRAFARLRQFLASHKDLTRRLEEHEKKLGLHDQAIAASHPQ